MEDNKKQVTENPEVTADQTPNESPNSVSGDVAQQGTSSTPSSEPVANTDSSTLDEQLKAATDGETVQESVSEEPASYDENMTMEDVMAASDKQMGKPPVHRGKIITGKIIMLANDGLIVDVGAKIEGLLPYTQLADTETTKEAAACLLYTSPSPRD